MIFFNDFQDSMRTLFFMEISISDNSSPGIGDSLTQLTTFGPNTEIYSDNTLFKTWEPFEPSKTRRKIQAEYAHCAI